MHTLFMQVRQLGQFRVLGTLPVASSSHRIAFGCHSDDEAKAPPSVVIKMLEESDGASFAAQKAQLAHEALLLRTFNHSCIPILAGEGCENQVLYIATEYVEGVNLAELLGHSDSAGNEVEESRTLSKEIAVYLIAQLADALDHLHTFEFIQDDQEHKLECLHRDLCPANVFLSCEGDVLLGDFGSARSCWLDPLFDFKDAGTVAYKAPERVTGSGEASVQSDLFALAVMLWEMLKGQRCFRAENELKTMDAIVRFDISQSSRRVPGLSAKLSEVLRRNLDRDPARRYSSAYHVLQRLAQSPEAGSAERARDELAQLVRKIFESRSFRTPVVTGSSPDSSVDNRSEVVGSVAESVDKSCSAWGSGLA